MHNSPDTALRLSESSKLEQIFLQSSSLPEPAFLGAPAADCTAGPLTGNDGDSFRLGTPGSGSQNVTVGGSSFDSRAQAEHSNKTVSDTARPIKRRNRPRVVCSTCFKRKIKCSRGEPCKQCKDAGQEDSCSYAPKPDKPKPTISKQTPKSKAKSSVKRKVEELATRVVEASTSQTVAPAIADPHPNSLDNMVLQRAPFDCVVQGFASFLKGLYMRPTCCPKQLSTLYDLWRAYVSIPVNSLSLVTHTQTDRRALEQTFEVLAAFTCGHFYCRINVDMNSENILLACLRIAETLLLERSTVEPISQPVAYMICHLWRCCHRAVRHKNDLNDVILSVCRTLAEHLMKDVDQTQSWVSLVLSILGVITRNPAHIIAKRVRIRDTFVILSHQPVESLSEELLQQLIIEVLASTMGSFMIAGESLPDSNLCDPLASGELQGWHRVHLQEISEIITLALTVATKLTQYLGDVNCQGLLDLSQIVIVLQSYCLFRLGYPRDAVYPLALSGLEGSYRVMFYNGHPLNTRNVNVHLMGMRVLLDCAPPNILIDFVRAHNLLAPGELSKEGIVGRDFVLKMVKAAEGKAVLLGDDGGVSLDMMRHAQDLPLLCQTAKFYGE